MACRPHLKKRLGSVERGGPGALLARTNGSGNGQTLLDVNHWPLRLLHWILGQGEPLLSQCVCLVCVCMCVCGVCVCGVWLICPRLIFMNHIP